MNSFIRHCASKQNKMNNQNLPLHHQNTQRSRSLNKIDQSKSVNMKMLDHAPISFTYVNPVFLFIVKWNTVKMKCNGKN